MPTAHILIGAGAGIVSATLFVSAVISGLIGGALLHILYPLPLCLAGLGWGQRAVAVAGLTATIMLAVLFGAGLALSYAVTMAIPMAVLVYLVMQSRPLQGAADQVGVAVEWYPIGRLVAAAALFAGALTGLMVLVLGPDAASYQDRLSEVFSQFRATQNPDASAIQSDLLDEAESLFPSLLPFAAAIGWLILALFNLWLAGTIAKVSGHALRPWPDLHSLEVPSAMMGVLAGASIAAFLPGIIGFIAIGFASAVLFAYVLQGLAVIHSYTIGMPLRPAMLAGVYLGIILFSWFGILAVAILGLGEPRFGLRARKSSTDQQTKND